jgi:hypothetical protein
MRHLTEVSHFDIFDGRYIMLRIFAFLSAGAVAVALAATPAMAAEQTNAGAPATAAVAGGPIYEPYAEAAAYLGQACAVIASKNISAVTHPAVGICCLTLGPTPVDSSRKPVVTVEWGASLGVALFAQYDNASISCGAGKIEVRNYKGDTGGVGSPLTTPVLSDRVADIVTVP